MLKKCVWFSSAFLLFLNIIPRVYTSSCHDEQNWIRKSACLAVATWAIVVVTEVLLWALMGRQAPCQPLAQISSSQCVISLKGDVRTAGEDRGEVKGKWSGGVDDVRAEGILGERDLKRWRTETRAEDFTRLCLFCSHRPCFCVRHFSIV